MILVFGGTTEGKKVVALLESLAMPFVYSTKTKIDFQKTKIASYRHGALDEAQLESCLTKNKIKIMINAAHPFAEALHNTIAMVAQRLQMPVIRFGRKPLAKTIHPLVFYVDSYNKALALLKENQRLLALTGVQSIDKIKSWWQNHPTYVRILNKPASLAIAAKSNFPKKQLILGLPSASLTKAIDLINTHQIDVTLTKETGSSGFLSTKIEAALKTNTQIIIISQPKIPTSSEAIVYSVDELELFITKTMAL